MLSATIILSPWRFRTIVLIFSIFRAISAQGIVDDSINLPSAPGWGDLRGCIQVCLNCDNMECFHNSVKTTSGCSTNKCLCSPSHLWNGLKFAYDCALADCKDYNDALLANG